MPEISDLVKKGKSLLVDGNFEDALAYFEQALLLNQNDPDIWNQKGAALRSLGRYDEALECFNKSLEMDPADKYSS
ncbi:MAG: tetratricopeptide repeat protein [Candidatus Nitrosotenuis sp.]|nr:MAG: tetratricopeptide repeat protein [Candidatus Nitrosotenuis sp.]